MIWTQRTIGVWIIALIAAEIVLSLGMLVAIRNTKPDESGHQRAGLG